jgi:hypothetical protein
VTLPPVDRTIVVVSFVPASALAIGVISGLRRSQHLPRVWRSSSESITARK